jgi:CheY-like chemotaxis protein
MPEEWQDAPMTHTSTGAPLRVLVVDDSHDGADSLLLLLEVFGHQARAAYDGGSALPLARAFRPAWTATRSPAGSAEAGFDPHLTKPTDLGRLQRLLAEAGRLPAPAGAA